MGCVCVHVITCVCFFLSMCFMRRDFHRCMCCVEWIWLCVLHPENKELCKEHRMFPCLSMICKHHKQWWERFVSIICHIKLTKNHDQPLIMMLHFCYICKIILTIAFAFEHYCLGFERLQETVCPWPCRSLQYAGGVPYLVHRCHRLHPHASRYPAALDGGGLPSHIRWVRPLLLR